MPLITCPDCGKQISDAAPACIQCGRPRATDQPVAAISATEPSHSAASAPATRSETGHVAREQSGSLGPLGAVLLVIGGVWLLFALSIDTSVSTGGLYGAPSRVSNLGLMNEKQNHVLAAGFFLVLGGIFTAVGRPRAGPQPESRQAPAPRPAAVATDGREITTNCARCSAPLTAREVSWFRGNPLCQRHFDEAIS
jgi:hypothetical protein